MKHGTTPFGLDYQSLAVDFSSRGVPTAAPGFCDHPAFVAIEQRDPRYFNHYAAFVAKQPYTDEYLARAKLVIDDTAQLLHSELLANGRLGACVDISGILLRILEREGVWSCVVKGSLTTMFPSQSGISPRYYWSVDDKAITAGHAWVFAPPYTVVDISVLQQPMAASEREFIPATVLSAEKASAPVDLRDIVSPSVRQQLLDAGIAEDRQLEVTAPFIPEIFAAFPAIAVPGLQGAMLKYIPVAFGAPSEGLREITCMSFDGLTPWEIYEQKFRGKVGVRTP